MAGSLAPSIQLQSSIVHALVMQDMSSRYAEGRLGILITIVEPALIVVGLYVMRYYIMGITQVAGVPLILFLLTGYMTFHCFRLLANGVASATQKKAPSQMFPQVTSMDAIIARAISSSLTYCGVMLLMFTATYLYLDIVPQDPLMVLVSVFLAFALGVPTGMIMGSVLRVYPIMKIFVSVFMRVNVLFSGSIFIASEVPPKILPYITWNPLFHVIEMMREAWFPGYISPIANPAYAVMMLVLLLAVAMLAERLTIRRRLS